MYKSIIFILFLAVYFGANAQSKIGTDMQRSTKDSLNMKHDSVISKPFVPKVKQEKIYYPDSTHSPRKAVMRSLYFPGLGQIYNRHGLWWRLPLIYGGLSALVYNIYSNGKDYNSFLRESEWRAHGRPYPLGTDGKQLVENGVLVTGEPFPTYNGNVITNIADQTIYDYKDNLRRNRDLSIFSFIGVWGINMIDAYVEAKFIHSYTMDNNLSFKITPSFTAPPVYASNFNTTFTPSVKITFLFR